ncbi:MAG: hypothetical protein RJA22_2155 [Verrucomicrobiota bacterium]
MGLLNLFSRPAKSRLTHLASGSFTVDRAGRVMTSTLPQTFPLEVQSDIGLQVLAAFRAAAKAQVPLQELVVHYGALKLLAREQRGGAMIFLTPHTLGQPAKRQP